jgi:hypothetical protein
MSDGPVARGILHVGGNSGVEASTYSDCVGANVVFFECDPIMALRCQANAAKFSQRCVSNCLSNVTGTSSFHVATNDGMSSSLRALGEHGDLYPDVTMRGAIGVTTTRYDEWKAAIPVGLLPDMNVLVVRPPRETRGNQQTVTLARWLHPLSS